MRKPLLSLGYLLLLVLFACSDEPSSEVIATAAATDAVEVAQIETPTTEPTEPPATATNTPTTEPTVTPEPSNTPTATASPTATPIPTATPTPIVLDSREAIDDAQRSRLTGELITDEEILNRRPIICKISNAPAKYTRPQSGIGSADLVFEHIAEGATRFSALFYSKTPEIIGPIRSARLIDTYLAPMYDAGLCFSGASLGVSERLETSRFRALLMRSYYEGYSRIERPDVPFEHTLFAEPIYFWEWLEEWEHNRRPESDTQTIFTELPPEGGDAADYLRIHYQDDWSIVEWAWDAELGRWTRTVDDVLAVDATTDEPVTAANVIVLFASHYYDETICDWQLEKVPERTADCLIGGLYPDLPDDGDLILLRDGQKFVGRWDGDGLNFPEFTYNDGEPLPLQIGNTWFQVLPYAYYETDRVSFELE